MVEGTGEDKENTENKEDKENTVGVVVSEEDKARLNEIDALFRECVVRAGDLIYNTFAGPDLPRATLILEIAKLYFAELLKSKNKGEGRAERE